MSQPLALVATPSNWRLFMVRKHDPRFLTFAKQVFARDQNTCQYCGFIANSWMDVVNNDGNYHHNRLENLVTACPLCAQCFFLESVGGDEFGGGVLIVCPELSQIELNSLCHVLFTAMISGGPRASDARHVYRGLRLRMQQTDKLLGDGLSQPAMLGRLLVEYEGDMTKNLLAKVNASVRLLPEIQYFAEPVKTWIQEALGPVGETL